MERETARGRSTTLAIAALALISIVIAACGASRPAAPAPTQTTRSGATVGHGAAEEASTAPAGPGVNGALQSSSPAATTGEVVAPHESEPSAASASPTVVATASPASPAATAPGDRTWTDFVHRAAIPLGDGRVATVPRVGYVDSCTTSFRGGGAQHDGPWIDHAHGTWDQDAKIAVLGERFWPNASYEMLLLRCCSAGRRA